MSRSFHICFLAYAQASLKKRIKRCFSNLGLLFPLPTTGELLGFNGVFGEHGYRQ